MGGLRSSFQRHLRRSAITLAVVALNLAFALAQSQTPQSEARFVSATALNVRLGPSIDQPIVARLTRGDQVGVRGRVEEWAQIDARGGAVMGWVAQRYLSVEAPPASLLSDARIRSLLIEESQRGYYGSCPCPYNVDRGGRRCGGRSAYSRPGGASPLCYASDVSNAQVDAYRRRIGR